MKMAAGVPHTVARVKPALIQCEGNITNTAKRLKCERAKLSNFINRTPELMEIVQQFRSALADLAEEALQKQIRRGDNACIIFTLKTQGRDRGYCENHRLMEISAQFEQMRDEFHKFVERHQKPSDGDGGNA